MNGGTSEDKEVSFSSADFWEITDTGIAPKLATSEQILAMISEGLVSTALQVRRSPEGQWGRALESAEFSYAFPYVNIASTREKGQVREVNGFVALNSNLARVLTLSRELRGDLNTRNPGFWFSALVRDIPAPILRRARIFEMWDDFWVAPVVQSSLLRPSDSLNVYLAVFNLGYREQKRVIRTTSTDNWAAIEGDLSLSVPPGMWSLRLLSAQVSRKPGSYSVEFTTRTGGERAATALITGVLTLGHFIYAPGSSGVSLGYEVVSTETAKLITDWEAFAIAVAEHRLTQADALEAWDGMQGRVTRDEMLRGFRVYLTPSLIMAALRDTRATPEAVVGSLIDEYAFDSFGVDQIEKVFLPK